MIFLYKKQEKIQKQTKTIFPMSYIVKNMSDII